MNPVFAVVQFAPTKASGPWTRWCAQLPQAFAARRPLEPVLPAFLPSTQRARGHATRTLGSCTSNGALVRNHPRLLSSNGHSSDIPPSV